MPIKPENKHRYPENWDQIRAQILERAGNRCEFCGLENYAEGHRDKAGEWYSLERIEMLKAKGLDPFEGTRALNFTSCKKRIKIVLTIAHLDHTPENNDPANLRALCQRCHNRYDQPNRQLNRKKAKAAGIQTLDL